MRGTSAIWSSPCYPSGGFRSQTLEFETFHRERRISMCGGDAVLPSPLGLQNKPRVSTNSWRNILRGGEPDRVAPLDGCLA
jgi:hypothetical protein